MSASGFGFLLRTSLCSPLAPFSSKRSDISRYLVWARAGGKCAVSVKKSRKLNEVGVFGGGREVKKEERKRKSSNERWEVRGKSRRALLWGGG